VTSLVDAVVSGADEADHPLVVGQEDTDGEDTEEDGLLLEAVGAGADRGALFAVDAVLLVPGQPRRAEERGGTRPLAHEAPPEGGVRGARQTAAAHLHPKNENCCLSDISS